MEYKLLEYVYAPDSVETVAWRKSPCSYIHSTQQLPGE
jgi:hypothetical protein